MDALEKRLEALDGTASTWRSRAARMGRKDEEKALECVRRMALAERQKKTVQDEIDAAGELLTKIRADLEAMDARLREMRRRKAAFVARENRADADVAMESAAHLESTDAVFDRWERRIALNEGRFESGDVTGTDRLADVFEREEEAVEMRALLDRIMREDGTHGNGGVQSREEEDSE